ncbi:DUF6020 family protein [Bifidobacterium choloepi]|uniref:DUF6020 family protein n=1 Tax=Bifidobacterium choloepi TaxID=2614131 RepID=UPI001E627388|nr:DUF6020 family protein [Bifidobacterium choloepi]
MTSSPSSSDNRASMSGDSAAASAPVHRGRERAGSVFRWGVAVLACLWISWCTCIGPIMRSDVGLAAFGVKNVLIFIAAFAVTFGIVLGLRWLGLRPARRMADRTGGAVTADAADSAGNAGKAGKASGRANRAEYVRKLLSGKLRMPAKLAQPHPRLRKFAAACARIVTKATDRWWKLWLIFLIGWLWVPATLLTAYGADINSQAREFSWAWNQWIGIKEPYIGFFSFVPMDIYPTAHYLWPSTTTYLTDQHNIVLTVFYGAVAAISRYFTGSNDAGYVTLSALQWLFATFAVASCANRFFNVPWVRRKALNDSHDSRGTCVSRDRFRRPELGAGWTQVDFAHPERGVRMATGTGACAAACATGAADRGNRPAKAIARFLIVLFFLTCPLVLFSTISITKSPLFAFGFVWWFGCLYEMYMTTKPKRKRDRTGYSPRNRSAVSTPSEEGVAEPMTKRGESPERVRRSTVVAMVLSVCVMLISAKYAWYILVAQIVLAILADRRRWKFYLATMLLPVIVIHGGTMALVATGKIIDGDPIESKGVQIQMIARVAKYDPESIPQSARDKLEPIFNLDQMAEAYSRQDADPVKSSGIQSKKVSYKWRTVTAEDMKQFNSAWLEIVEASPRVAIDAFFMECYGYFDIFDPPYVEMTYYVNNDYVQGSSTWIKDYNHEWRDTVAGSVFSWSRIPVLGWYVHGNFYVTLTLLVGAAELVLRRWRTLAWHMPLLILMGVMVMAPANNFERHMLPLVFVFGFLLLQFYRDSHRYARRDEEKRPGREPKKTV